MKKRINGSIRPRPNAENVQYYDITLELGTDPATGKRKRMYFKVNTTDREEAENELINSILCFCVCETKNSEIPCAPS